MTQTFQLYLSVGYKHNSHVTCNFIKKCQQQRVQKIGYSVFLNLCFSLPLNLTVWTMYSAVNNSISIWWDSRLKGLSTDIHHHHCHCHMPSSFMLKLKLKTNLYSASESSDLMVLYKIVFNFHFNITELGIYSCTCCIWKSCVIPGDWHTWYNSTLPR